GGIGRAYPDDPLCGRDDAGPIFPTGPSDTRLPAQAAVIGVIGPDGQPVAFSVDAARAELAEGRPVALGGIELRADGGLRATGADGRELVTQQSFWFAWSQFHPSTDLWAPADAASADPAGPRTGASEACWEVIDPADR